MKLTPITGVLPLSDQADSRVLLIAEGFEDRSLAWIRSLPPEILFKRTVIFKNLPIRKSRLSELVQEVKTRSIEIQIVDFDRFDPVVSEYRIESMLAWTLESCIEVVIDISVMSKLLIMMLFVMLRSFPTRVRCIYSEAETYAPTEAEYKTFCLENSNNNPLPSQGVHDVIRTPLLSSSIMQTSPNLIIAFTSFNEQLIRALLSSISPANLLLINGAPPHLKWRRKATQDIHLSIIEEFKVDNQIVNGELERQSSTLDYRESFVLLSDIYRTYSFTRRLVLAPTGSKMQTVACALFKICCPDVHVEYPTPESFYVRGYSGEKVREIHQIEFQNFARDVAEIGFEYGLNGDAVTIS